MIHTTREAAAWDSQYRDGRYVGEPPVAFVKDILDAARLANFVGQPGLYIGCGNGRNYLPLLEGGLDLVGLDISRVAIEQLGERLPDGRSKLIVGDISAVAADLRFPIVIGLQVFQHGNRSQAHEHIRAAQERVTPGGLFCLRVNAIGTDVEYNRKQTERGADGGYTIRYLQGPKSGLDVHFFSEQELADLFDNWKPVLALRPQVTWREPPHHGQWTQWEAIWSS
jgi:predicted TPR repeat methyltransferase